MIQSLTDRVISSGMKSSFIRNRGYVIFKMVLVITLLMNGFLAKSQNTVYSPEFNSLINQFETIYCKPSGKNYQEIRKNEPLVFAALMGHGLRQQLLNAQKDPALKPGFDLLQQEAMRYVFESDKTFKYLSANGQPINIESLWTIVQDGIRGLNDEKILKEFKVSQGSAPSILLANPTPRNGEGQSLGKQILKKETAITLFNIEAPKVEGGPWGVVVNEEFIDMGFKLDDVIGTWQDFWKGSDTSKAYFGGEPPYCTLKITKEKVGEDFYYLGKVVNKSPGFYTFFNCKEDGTMFHVVRENPQYYIYILGRYNGVGFGNKYGEYNDTKTEVWNDNFSIFMNPDGRNGWILTVLGNFAGEASNSYLFRKTGD